MRTTTLEEKVREAKLSRIQAESNLNILVSFFKINSEMPEDQKNLDLAMHLLGVREAHEIELIFEYTKEQLRKI